LPGYAVTLEPGLSIGRVRNVFIVSFPIAIRRHAGVRVADLRTQDALRQRLRELAAVRVRFGYRRGAGSMNAARHGCVTLTV
jgi:hypothetical protein